MARDNARQHLIALGQGYEESGDYDFVSGATVAIATNMQMVLAGSGYTENDGLVCIPTTGQVTDGAVTFTRRGSVETAADKLHYRLVGY